MFARPSEDGCSGAPLVFDRPKARPVGRAPHSMSSKNDLSFLALLVHRAVLARGEAERLLPSLKQGAALDDLLEDELGWSPEEIARLRRTEGGRVPEIPGYRLQGSLGTGGTADVYKAHELRTGRTLALKVLRPECARERRTLKAFVDEARLLERLDHPGLVRGYGPAKSGTTYFNRLELVVGQTLFERLDAGQAFNEDAALRVILETAEVLCYLEGESVIHRDVKPGNIMVRDDGRVKLIDLGFAATEPGAADPDDSTVGTVAYLSPEQASGAALADSRSDIYSLGVSLFHLVVGRLPFESSDDRETLRMQIMESLTSPELKGRGISPHLHYFIEKMMAKEADHRFQNFAELIAEIREQLRGASSLDFESSARVRPTRPRRRFRG